MTVSRRDFLRVSSLGGGALALGLRPGRAVRWPSVAPRNPYAGVDWAGHHVPSLSHAHGRTLSRFNTFLALGYRHLAISDYYPSDPALIYPLTNIPGVTPERVPEDAVGCPNAEHHSFTDCLGHAGAIGSALASGSPREQRPVGFGGPWRAFVDASVAAMVYPGGGGIVLNHPRLAYMGDAVAAEWLDYSEAVLGVEVYNHFAEWNYGGKGWALETWHNLLVTGRRCFGFFTLDHYNAVGGAPGLGRNVLLLPPAYAWMSPPEREAACAGAYRRGEFYGQLGAGSPALTRVEADGGGMSVAFLRPCEVSFVYAFPGDREPRRTAPVWADGATYELAGGEVYVRAEGWASPGQAAFTQPVMFGRVTAVEPGLAAASLLVFPNPVDGVVTVAGATGDVEVVDASGRVVLRGRGPALDVSGLPAGAYAARTERGLGRFTVVR